MNLIRKSKPIRGSRKIQLREFPWGACIKYFTIFLIIGILGYQFLTLRVHATNLAQSQQLNSKLTTDVSLLASDLQEERIASLSSLVEQSNDLEQMKVQIEKLTADLSKTKQDNSDLSAQLKSVKTQNDVFRNKLETMLGQASRSGSELTPSPIGKSGLTLKELQKLTKGSTLVGIEPALLQIETTYNCNALYALAVAKLETGGGTSELCRNHNNLFGMRARSGWISFKTKADSVISFGKLMKNNYFGKGFNTLAKIGPRYAEGSTTWDDKAKYHMTNDMRKLFH